ncbi:MAG: SMC-Scp complex subunit ScpB [Oligoflexales bacterium]
MKKRSKKSKAAREEEVVNLDPAPESTEQELAAEPETDGTETVQTETDEVAADSVETNEIEAEAEQELFVAEETESLDSSEEEASAEEAEDAAEETLDEEFVNFAKANTDLYEYEGTEFERELDTLEKDPGLSLSAKVEAVIFGSPKPISAADILEIIQTNDGYYTLVHVNSVLEDLESHYAFRQGGLILVHLKGEGYQFRTVEAAASLMEKLFASRPRPLSRASLETLSIVAYKQPITRAGIEFIRGVESGNILKGLIEKNLVECVGRKEDVVGKPMVFGTTAEFCRVFGLGTKADLPPLSSFQPSQEMLKNAMDPEDSSAVDSPDLEQYFDDSEDNESVEALQQLEESIKNSDDQTQTEEDIPSRIEGATIEGVAFDDVAFDDEDALKDFEADVSETPTESTNQEEEFSAPETDATPEPVGASSGPSGDDANSEVDIADGDSVEERSRDLD